MRGFFLTLKDWMSGNSRGHFESLLIPGGIVRLWHIFQNKQSVKSEQTRCHTNTVSLQLFAVPWALASRGSYQLFTCLALGWRLAYTHNVLLNTLNFTFRFLVSTFCHCAVELQHQPFTPYKDKSSNTAVPGLFVPGIVLHCVLDTW